MFCNKCGNEIKEGEKFCAKCGNKIEKSKIKDLSIGKRILLIMVAITIIMFIVAIIIYEYNSNDKVLDNVKQTNESNIENNVNEDINQVNIDEETKSNIKKLYSRVSGYDSSDIIKAMYWELGNGTPTLLISYQNTNRNGIYIQIEGTRVFQNYGDEESLYEGSGRTMRNSKELLFSMYQDSDDHIFFTGDEFRELIK